MASNLLANRLIGIDLGVVSTRFGIVNSDGEVHDKWSIPTDTSDRGAHIIPDIVSAINQRLILLDLDKSEFIGIGMSLPGTVDVKKSTVRAAYNLNWAETQQVGTEISAGVELPFVLDNDANVAALGERWMGAGKGCSDIVYMMLDSGVGGGIIAGSKIVHGMNGAGGEIGHICVEPTDGLECTCGKHGCLETVVSKDGIMRIASQMAQDATGESSVIAKRIQADESVVFAELVEAAQMGDAFSSSVIDRFAYYIGFTCANVGVVLNPDLFIIGGYITEYGDFLLDRIRSYFHKYAFSSIDEATRIEYATLGEDAKIIGAANLAIQLKRKMALQNLR